MNPPRQSPPPAFMAMPNLGALPPTQAQIEEARQLRALQLRTNAVQFAIAMLGGREGESASIIREAECLVEYLEKG